ncbi:hypothetical protein OIU80_20075 [Flavobacterium sp. LS1R47]|uniref:Uncharacterized protein n=1 Tax=Flavobacterium frigoritolerans TaxID=2987686 RepID=A0A9X3CAJ3_9FLAO|nr:hypothetical protein [Flavobacterium frigoritolerans]MCV9934586.1 hypothetical protein [Flavobacterium frigoritolerans]
MKNKIINIFIGLVLVIFGMILHNTGKLFWEYLGIFFIIYGFFVILVKFFKIVILLKNKQLNAFEKSNNRIIPNAIRKILEFQLKNNIKIEFEMPCYGTFQVIDYHIREGDNFSNPYFILKEIDEHIKRYLFPVINCSKIIPFAKLNNNIFLYVEEGKEDIHLIDIDSNSKPLVINSQIDRYLDIGKLVLNDDKYYYNGLEKIDNIVDNNYYFFDVPDCIWEGKDYLETFIKSFNLLEEKNIFSLLSIEDTAENYELTLNINDKSKKMTFRRYSDYIDGEKFIESLNEILLLINYVQKKFYLISINICDFGIVLADEPTYRNLLYNGCIDFDNEKLKLTSDELNDIRNYSDLITEIENVEFHLKIIIKEHNEIKKGVIYDFFYKTEYVFDNYGINELKKTLNVQVEKVESGYDIYFTK